MTNKEKFKEVFGLEMDDTSDCGFFDCSDRQCKDCPVKDTKHWWNAEYKEPTTKNDLALIHTEGLDEEIRCTMCTNSMKSNRGCDGSCVVNKDMYKAVMDAIEKRIQPTTKNDLEVDAVSRQAVLDIAKASKSNWIDNSILFKRVNELPTVTPQEPRWIPVSERLPKEDGEYLLFGKINEDEENYIFVGEYDSCGEQFGIWQEQFDRATLGCLGSEFFEYSCVIAWMPLPKPYKAESEG